MASQQNAPDNTGIIWAAIAIILGGMAFWYFGRRYMVMPLMLFRQGELYLIEWFFRLWNPIGHVINFAGPDREAFTALHEMFRNVDPGKISWQEFVSINTLVGNWTRYLVFPILVVLAVLLKALHKAASLRTAYNMSTLRRDSVGEWPQIIPSMTLNLVKEPIDSGPWAMAKTPLMYCQEEGIIFEKELKSYRVWGVRAGPAYRLLALQLGPQLTSLAALPIHVKAILVVCLCRATRKREASNQFIRQISASAASGRLDFTGVDEMLAKLQNERALQWARARHAYVYTLMGTMLEIGRSDGVLASAEFLWLKPVDRRLWFMINSIGRQTAPVEIAGAYSHWLAERKVGRPLKTPMVKEAVLALSEAMEEILVVNKDDSWRSKEG